MGNVDVTFLFGLSLILALLFVVVAAFVYNPIDESPIWFSVLAAFDVARWCAVR